MSALLPPSDINARNPKLVTIFTGEILHRFFRQSRDPVYFDRSLLGRLNAPNGAYGVLYAAKDARGAFAETFLRTPSRRTLDPGLVRDRAHVALELTRPITLIDFDGPGLVILGATAEIIHGGLPYDCAQAWSAALHAHPAGIDGIAYSARHDPHQTCYALFERSADAVEERDRTVDLDIAWFWDFADVYNVGRSP